MSDQEVHGAPALRSGHEPKEEGVTLEGDVPPVRFDRALYAELFHVSALGIGADQARMPELTPSAVARWGRIGNPQQS